MEADQRILQYLRGHVVIQAFSNVDWASSLPYKRSTYSHKRGEII